MKRQRSDFQVIADKGGFMIYYKGHGVSGAGIRGRAVRKQINDYLKQAEIEIQNILNDRLDVHQRNRLAEIDAIN